MCKGSSWLGCEDDGLDDLFGDEMGAQSGLQAMQGVLAAQKICGPKYGVTGNTTPTSLPPAQQAAYFQCLQQQEGLPNYAGNLMGKSPPAPPVRRAPKALGVRPTMRLPAMHGEAGPSADPHTDPNADPHGDVSGLGISFG